MTANPSQCQARRPPWWLVLAACCVHLALICLLFLNGSPFPSPFGVSGLAIAEAYVLSTTLALFAITFWQNFSRAPLWRRALVNTGLIAVLLANITHGTWETSANSLQTVSIMVGAFAALGLLSALVNPLHWLGNRRAAAAPTDPWTAPAQPRLTFVKLGGQRLQCLRI